MAQTHDVVWLVQGLVQTSRHAGLPLYLLKVDIVKAFDRVHKSSLIRAMVRRDVDPSVIQNVVCNWENERSIIEYARQQSTPIVHARGTRQGDPTSPILFR